MPVPVKKNREEKDGRPAAEDSGDTGRASASSVAGDFGPQVKKVTELLEDARNRPPESLQKSLQDLRRLGLKIMKSGEEADPKDIEAFRQEYSKLKLDKTDNDFMLQSIEYGINEGWGKLEEFEKVREKFSRPEFAALLPEEFKEKLRVFKNNIDSLAKTLNKMEAKKAVATEKLSQPNFLAPWELFSLSGDLDMLRKEMKALENNFGKVDSDVKERRALENRLNKLALNLHEVKEFANESAEELAFVILKKISEMKSGRLDAEKVENLEAMAENRIFAVQKKNEAARQAEAKELAERPAREAREREERKVKESRERELAKIKGVVEKGLDKTEEKLDKLLDGYIGFVPSGAKELSGIQIAQSLFNELREDAATESDPDKLKQKFSEYERNLELAERTFIKSVEPQAVKKRGEALIKKLMAIKNNPDLPSERLDYIETWLDSIPKKKSLEDIARIEELAEERVLGPIRKEKAPEEAEKEFFAKGEKMGAAPVMAEMKKTAKDVLKEAGVVDIKPQEFLDKLEDRDMEQLGEMLKAGDKRKEEALGWLRSMLQQYAKDLAAEYRDGVSRETYAILASAVQLEKEQILLDLQRSKLDKMKVVGKAAAILAANVGLSVGIGFGLGAGAKKAAGFGVHIARGALAGSTAGGAILATRFLNGFVAKRIGESERYQKAKEKAGSFWDRTVGKLFKKEKPPDEEIINKVVEKMDLKDQLSVIFANQIRENTSKDVREKIKTYSAEKDEALGHPSAETEDEFSAALDKTSSNFYRNALNYVEVAYPEASAEQKKQMALVIERTIGGYERGDVKEAQVLKDLQTKAPDKKYWLVEGANKMIEGIEKLSHTRAEVTSAAVIYGVGAAVIGSLSDEARIAFGMVAGAAGGLALEKLTRGDAEQKKNEKETAKLISETEKKLAGRAVWDVAEADLRKAGENAASVLSNLRRGLLDKNPLLKNRAENFVAFVNRMKIEAAEMAGDDLNKRLEDLVKDSFALEKQTKKTIDRLSGGGTKKRKFIFAFAGALLGGAGVEGLHLLFGGAVPEKPGAGHAEHLPAKTGVRLPTEEKVDMDFTKPETLPPAGEKIDMDFTKPPETPLVPVHEVAGAGHGVHGGIAEIRTFKLPENPADLYRQVGADTARDIMKLDEGGYHKIATDLLNAVRRVDILEHNADALPAGTPAAEALHHQAEVLRGQLSEAEKVLHGGHRAEAAEMFRDISRQTLHAGIKPEVSQIIPEHRAEQPTEQVRETAVKGKAEFLKGYAEEPAKGTPTETPTEHLEIKPAKPEAVMPTEYPADRPIDLVRPKDSDFVGPPEPSRPEPFAGMSEDYLKHSRGIATGAVDASRHAPAGHAAEAVAPQLEAAATTHAAPAPHEVEKVIEAPKTATPIIEEPKVEHPAEAPKAEAPHEAPKAVEPKAEPTHAVTEVKHEEAATRAAEAAKAAKEKISDKIIGARGKDIAGIDKTISQAAAEQAVTPPTHLAEPIPENPYPEAGKVLEEAHHDLAVDQAAAEESARQAAQVIREARVENWGDSRAVHGSGLIEKIFDKDLPSEQESAFEKLVKRFDSAVTHRRGGKTLDNIVKALEKLSKQY